MILSLNSFSQEKKLSYYFDYYTVYEYKKEDKKNSETAKNIYFSNSKDSTFILSVTIKDNIVTNAAILDYKNLKITIFKDERILNNYNDVRLFNNASTTDYNLDICRSKTNYFYEINDREGFSHSIKKYKNSKKKKIVDEFIYETKVSDINTNHNYNFGQFVNPLWCWKITLTNKDLITNSYFLIKGKKKHLRKLEEFTKTDFTITIDNLKIIQ